MTTERRGVVPQWDQGDRLTKALKESHTSVQDMANFLGVHRNTVNNYASGRVAIRKAHLMLWAQRTGVDLAWLQDGLDPSTPPAEADKLPARPTGGTFIKRSVTAATEGTPQHEAQADS